MTQLSGPPSCALRRILNLVGKYREKENTIMLWAIFVILLVLWAIGFFAAYATFGGLVHILLVVALIVLIINLVQGRRIR